MYVLKYVIEDFQVGEVCDVPTSDSGQYSIYKLSKRNYNTLDAVKKVARVFGKSMKDIGFAGTKDRRAITTQYVSVNHGPEKDVQEEDFSLDYLGKSSEKIALGTHSGNWFRIVVRNLDREEVDKLQSYESNPEPLPNFFGPQRFGKNNALVGKCIVQGKFKEAVAFVVEQGGEQQELVEAELAKNDSNYVGALQKLPLPLLKLYIGSFQSLLFNHMLKQTTSNNKKIPLVGFGTDPIEIENKEIRSVLKETLKQASVKPRDFVIRQFPQLTAEGQDRDAFFMPEQFKVESVEDDEFHTEKKAITVSFTLKPSCYATTVIDLLLNNGQGILNDLV